MKVCRQLTLKTLKRKCPVLLDQYNVYLIVLADSLDSCNRMYTDGKYLRLFGDFNPIYIGRFLKALEVDTFNSKCNVKMKPDFLRDLDTKLDMEIKYKGDDIDIYAEISIVKNNTLRFLRLIADENNAKIISCEAPK